MRRRGPGWPLAYRLMQTRRGQADLEEDSTRRKWACWPCCEAVEPGGYRQTAEMEICGPQAPGFLSPLAAEECCKNFTVGEKDSIFLQVQCFVKWEFAVQLWDELFETFISCNYVLLKRFRLHRIELLRCYRSHLQPVSGGKRCLMMMILYVKKEVFVCFSVVPECQWVSEFELEEEECENTLFAIWRKKYDFED